MTEENINYCHICGKIATIFDTDPYLDELYPDEDREPEWFCDECFQDAISEI